VLGQNFSYNNNDVGVETTFVDEVGEKLMVGGRVLPSVRNFQRCINNSGCYVIFWFPQNLIKQINKKLKVRHILKEIPKILCLLSLTFIFRVRTLKMNG